MAWQAIKSDEFCLASNTVIYVTVLEEALAIETTEGRLTVECANPRFALRDYIAGQPLDFRVGTAETDARFGYGLRVTRLSKRPPRLQCSAPLPDNVAVRDGWFVVESAKRTDYHRWESLQIIGLTRSGQAILGFAAVTYQVSFSTGPITRKQLAQFVDGFGGKHSHWTVHPADAFFNWVVAPRIYCERIQETRDSPESFGGFVTVADFRSIPVHAQFMTQAATMAGPAGPAIGL